MNDFEIGLAAGQLVKDEYFTLFESVGALEIMDSKMDTGCIAPGKEVEIEQDPAEDLLPEEVLWIMDELICREIAWLEYYPLSQTVFTSVHIDRILDPDNKSPYPFELRPSGSKTFTNQVLHPYCTALLKCSSMVLELARSQGFYEEEDFVSQTFGRELVPDITTEEAIQRLTNGLDWTISHVTDVKVRRALDVRLTFRTLFISSIFGQMNGWNTMIELLDEIESSRELAKSKPSCFTTKVLRYLATSTPPRPPLITSGPEAKASWRKLCLDVSSTTQLTTPQIRQSPACLYRAMWAFAAREASTLPRSIIQDILFVDGKITDDLSHFDLFLSDLRELVLPGHHLVDPDSFQVEAVKDVRHVTSRHMEAFLDSVLDSYINMYRLLCQNRARIRRQTTQMIKILDEHEQLQARSYDKQIEAVTLKERHDTVLGMQQSLRPLTIWTRYQKLKMMTDSILLGFETDIYLPDEFSHMYWYLSLLMTERRRLIEHVEVFTTRRAQGLQKATDRLCLAECISSLQYYAALLAELEAQTQLADALNKLYAVLMHFGLVKAPKRSFAEAKLCHEVRMKIYLDITDPAPPTLEAFKTASTLTGTVSEAISQIEQHIQLAKKNIASLKLTPPEMARYIGTETRWKQEMKQLETTAVGIFVAVTQIKRATDGAELEITIPPPGKRYHDWWVVPQLKQKR